MKKLPILTCLLLAPFALLSIGKDLIRGADAVAPPASSTAEPANAEASAQPQEAQTPSEKKPVDGGLLLQTIRQKLIEYQPFKATILETVAIGPRKFKVAGDYIQGKDLRLRLEFQLQVGSTDGALLSVCDGHILSTRLKIGDKLHVTRRDVRQILKAALDHGGIPENMLVADLGLGGLSGLLASLERNMTIGPATEETIDDKRFTVVEGTWKEEFVARWRQSAVDGEDKSRLPDHIPDKVRVYVDENQFPRRVLYLKQPRGSKLFRPMVTLDFTSVVLNTAVSDEEFHFVPPDGVFPIDVTNQYLQQLVPAANSPGANAPAAASETSPPAAQPAPAVQKAGAP